MMNECVVVVVVAMRFESVKGEFGIEETESERETESGERVGVGTHALSL